MPEVSVVMAVHNGERFLSDSIQSIQRQTFPDWELVAVDDGSTDGTLAGLKDFEAADPRVRALPSRRRGLSGSLNLGVAQAKGRLIARQDVDDLSLPDRLARQVRCMEVRTDLVLLGARCREAAPWGEYVWPYYPDHVLERMVYRRNPFAHTSVVFRKAAFESIGGYDESLSTSQDFDLWIRLASVGRISMMEDVLVRIAVREDAVSRTRRLSQCLNSMRIRLKYCRGPKGPGYLIALYEGVYRFAVAFCPGALLRLYRRRGLFLGLG